MYHIYIYSRMQIMHFGEEAPPTPDHAGAPTAVTARPVL